MIQEHRNKLNAALFKLKSALELMQGVRDSDEFEDDDDDNLNRSCDKSEVAIDKLNELLNP